jgi:hypothetical protein
MPAPDCPLQLHAVEHQPVTWRLIEACRPRLEAAEMSQLKDTVEILAPIDLRNSYWNRTPLKVQYVVISLNL